MTKTPIVNGERKRQTVAFVTLILSHYRVPFHMRVRDTLARHGIEYRLIYGDPAGSAALKGDTVALPWATRVPVRMFKLGNTELFWQKALTETRDADLTIVSQENKLLLNYALQARYLLRGKKVAFFGHGKNFQAKRASGWRAALKRRLAKHVHWWFAYTPGVGKIVTDCGFPAEKITVNYNAIDTVGLRAEFDSIGSVEMDALKRKYGLAARNMAIFVGGMYDEKRLPFLFEAASRIRSAVPDFELFLIGAGSHSHLAREAAEAHDFVHFLGPLFGRDKAGLLKMSKTLLMPGLVGLAVMDAFAAGCPLITTDVSYHSPELEYLEDGRNGLIVREADSVDAYADAVVRVLRDETYRAKLASGALASSELYTIENMADNVSKGVLAALAQNASSSAQDKPAGDPATARG